jgi:acyl-CoA reductase-like NAD-dependent aldehyde dehydrogenase
VKRVYIHESIFPEFRDAMVAYTKTLKFGDGFAEDSTHGPVQNSIQYALLQGFLDDIEKDGQKIAVGGRNSIEMGYFISPTIVDRPNDDSRIAVEEPFGMHLN